MESSPHGHHGRPARRDCSEHYSGLRHRFVALAVAAAAVVANSPAAAQCEGEWLPGAPVPGVASAARLPIPFVWATITWDPDGAGPQPPVLVVGGEFDTVGSVRADNIAMWDGQSWSSPGTIGPINPAANNPPTRVQAFAVAPNGDLIVGGRFTSADGVQVNNIARWDGSTWSSIGTGVTGGSNGSFPVHALAVLPNGDIIAAGNFANAGGQFNTDRIARWDGTAWSSVGGGVTNGGTENSPIRSLLAMPDGDLIAGGWFSEIGGVPANFIARWDSDTDTWSPLGTGTTSAVTCLALTPDGDLIAGGSFSQAGGVFGTSRIARWDGGSWSPLWSGADGTVDTLAIMPDGALIAAGVFDSMSGVPGTDRVARWDPDALEWSAMGEGLRWQVYASAVLDGDYYAGGDIFGGRGSTPALTNIARWDGDRWSQVGSGNAGEVHMMTELPNGDILVGGVFDQIDGVAASKVARWSAADGVWQPLGAGVDGNPDDWSTLVLAATAMPNGDIVVGGTFLSAGGVPGTNGIARWDGAAWHAIGNGVSGTVNTVVAMPSGDLIVGGQFDAVDGVPGTSDLARWDGAAWHDVGFATADGTGLVRQILPLSNGDLIVVGHFTLTNGVSYVARWDGSSWSPLGGGVGGAVFCILELPNGDIVVGGQFTSAGGTSGIRGIARWDGSTWSAFGSGTTQRVGALGFFDGNLIAGGRFTSIGGVPDTSRIARWDGSAWSAMGSGVNDIVYSLATFDGALWVGGVFSHAGGAPSTLIGRWACDLSCPADWNDDGTVNSGDISSFLTSWIASVQAPDLVGDFNSDGVTNSGDISAFLTAWIDAVQNGC